ncbi:Connector enhancer of kinase suppressor of ras 1, partial [Pterocles gutturalis]
WVSRLITAKTKYTLAHQSVPDREEDCYSETEAEDPDDESPRHGCDLPKKRLQNTPEKSQLFPASSEPSSVASSPQGSPRPSSPMASSKKNAGEDLECLMQCLKQGGVSLIGRQRFLTQEQCRKSFVRRNKNPQSCTRSCGSGGHGSTARMMMRGWGLSMDPPKRRPNPDNAPGP